MMNSLFRRLPRLPLLVILTLCLLTAGHVNPGHARCLDRDGQAGFIPATSVVCCPEAASPAVVAPPAQTCCGDKPCPDLSSHPQWRSKRSRVLNAKLLSPAPAAGLIVAPLALVGGRDLRGQFPAPSRPRIPETILLHRTVVLLI